MRDNIFLILCFALLISLSGCSGSELTVEDEIRQYIDRGIQAAEDRDTGDLLDMAHDSYGDNKGLDKVKLGKMLRLYFFQHKNIHLFKKINEIIIHGANEATVKMHVAMAGTAIANAGVLAGLRARVYAFELQLVKQDEWLLRQAKWRPANLSAIE